MTPIRVGIVGTGRMAAAMAAAMAHVPQIVIAAVASASGGKARAEDFARAFGRAGAYGSIAELLARDDLDLVYVANHTRDHARASIAALEAGKNVLCEKPFATSSAEARAVAETARRSGKLFLEAMWTPLLPAFQRAEAVVREGRIGTPMHLVASFGYPGATESQRGAFDTNGGGGALLDGAVYPIWLALKLMGPVEQVSAAATTRDDGLDVSASLTLVHASGAQSQLACSITTLLANTATVSGARGSLTLEAPLAGCEEITIRQAKAPSQAAPLGPASAAQTAKDKLRALSLLRRVARNVSSRREHLSYGANQYVPLLEHVAGLLQSGSSASEILPLDFSVAAIGIIEQARNASRNGKEPVS